MTFCHRKFLENILRKYHRVIQHIHFEHPFTEGLQVNFNFVAHRIGLHLNSNTLLQYLFFSAITF